MDYEYCEKQREYVGQFVLIENFSVKTDIGILRGKKPSVETPSSIVDCYVKELVFRMNPIIYNYFANISEAFVLNENDEAWIELFHDKKAIIQAQRMAGVIKKRSNGIKKNWYKYYGCLSGGYLYFYETNRQVHPSTYFYLKNTEVIEGTQEICIANTLILRNKREQCFLAFNTKEDCLKWKKAIDEVIQEISYLSELIYKKGRKQINYNDLQSKMCFAVDKFVIVIIEEDGKELARGQCFGMESIALKRAADIIVDSKIKNIEMNHIRNLQHPLMLFSEKQIDILSFRVSLLEKKSPLFKVFLIQI